AMRPQAEAQGVQIHVQAAPDLPQISVDPERMAQVLGNLVANALRYTPENGNIRLSARIEQGKTILEVQDSGEGIAPEDLPFIFNRFYRGSKSRHPNGEAGLGLAIAKSLVEAHGGRISIQSQPGRGAKFTIIM
ncbi:MAG: sensor histidine kinase, partial [Anaerolineales bacterium]